MASVAVIQGSSKGIGFAFVRHLLINTKLNVVATSASASPTDAAENILRDLPKGAKERLTTLALDVKDEGSIEKAAKDVEGKWGKELRLLVNVSGVLKPEKSILKVDREAAQETFDINTLGHLLAYKHFVPLLPPKEAKGASGENLASGVLPEDISVLASMTARVGSIGDNARGGWYSYRASKAATNQIVVTLQRELAMRSILPTIALALHPGTVAGTALSEAFVPKDRRGTAAGIHGPENAVESLFSHISKMTEKDGGRFIDWQGKDIPW